VKKNRVDRLEMNLKKKKIISSSSEYIANSSTIMRVFIELNNDFISCIHRASAHMQNYPYLCIGCKYKDVFYIFGTN
jgi:hypothetical protein